MSGFRPPIPIQADRRLTTMSPFRPLALAAAFATVLPAVAPAQDGTLDPTFGIAGKQRVVFDRPPLAGDGAFAAAVQPDGRIVLAGDACSTVTDCMAATARLLPGGALDPTFNGDGQAAFDFHPDATINSSSAVLVRPDGRIYVVAHVATPAGVFIGLVRLTADGLFDDLFGDPGTPGRALRTIPGGALWVAASDALLQADGKIVVGGTAVRAGFTDRDMFVARFTATGALDPTFSGDGVSWIAFDRGGSNDDYLNELIHSGGGGFLAAGPIAAGGGDGDTGIARLTATGALDTAFGGTGAIGWEANDIFGDQVDTPMSLRLQPDGRLLVLGTAQSVGGGFREIYFGRVLTNGDYDPTLTVAVPNLVPGVGDEDGVAIDFQGDLKLLVAAEADGDCLVARFGVNGATLDPTFGQGGVTHVSGWLGDDAHCTGMTFTGRGPVLFGDTRGDDLDFLIAQLRTPFFRDGFETGNTSRWSSVAP
jgi:uncharacterized delta-60 repeat protein